MILDQDGSILATTSRTFLNANQKSDLLKLTSLNSYKGINTDHIIRVDRFQIQTGDISGYVALSVNSGIPDYKAGYILKRIYGRSNDRGFVLGFFDTIEKYTTVSNSLREFGSF